MNSIAFYRSEVCSRARSTKSGQNYIARSSSLNEDICSFLVGSSSTLALFSIFCSLFFDDPSSFGYDYYCFDSCIRIIIVQNCSTPIYQLIPPMFIIGPHSYYNKSYQMRPICALFLLLLASATALTARRPSLLANCEPELKEMVMAFEKGDTSTAFSIAMKVHVAVQMLHQDLQIVQDPPKIVQAVNCEQALSSIVHLAKANTWEENFEQMMKEVAEMKQHCTNSDFKELPKEEGQNGGFDNECAICVVVLRVMENYVTYHKLAVPDFVNKEFCQLFDNNVKPTCEAFIHYAGPVIIQTLVSKAPSDKACLALGLCRNKECRILSAKHEQYDLPPVEAPKVPSPWKWLIHIFVDRFGNGHFPVFDMDNDTYSDVSTFRGYHWRGADCNELNANIYPGRKTGSKLLDNDCNGIFGMDNRGRLYEDKFCAPYKRYGVAVIGDSAGAHFSIPEKYFNVSMMQKGTFDDLLPRLADELDLPQESGYTGHTVTSYASRSVYKYLRDWNLCNHNDFQNIAVNGADSDNSRNNIPALKRNPKEDYPLIMFLELIGNDVCSKSLESERKPEDFKKYIIRLLNTIDNMVPAGSHMIIFGLGDGGLLYDNLHDDIHPLNVTYDKVYEFLNCLKISPCWSWLNSNGTVRNYTTERAINLSKIYPEIIAENTFKNFDIAYYDFPAMEILQRKVLEGGDPHTMIERCDGFHPNGQFHSYLADWVWVKLKNDHPDWIGQRNPHNEEIRNIFGLEILK